MKSQIPHHSHFSGQTAPPTNAIGKWLLRLLLFVLIVIFIFVASITLWLAYEVFKPQIQAFFQVPTSTFSPTSTPKCVHSTLGLGPYTYPMDVVTPPKDGTLPTLAKPAGTAWLLSETSNPYVIIFVPALKNLDMRTALKVGDELVVQWADCKREVFILSDFQLGIPDAAPLFEQASPGIAVIVQRVGGKAEYVILGQVP